MKIKFVANYDNDINIYKSILNCFKLTDEQKNMLTYNDDYEYLGIFNGYRGQIKTTRDKIFGFLQEPIGNVNYDRNLHFYCSKIFCQSSEMFKPNKGIIKTHLSMFFSNHTNYSYENFLNDSFKKDKKLCIFVSGISAPNNPNWINHNYTKRLNLIKKIIDSDLDIDIYGRNLKLSDKRYKGSPDNKHEVLNTAKLKEITSQETLSGRGLYEDQSQFRPVCHHMVTTNYHFAIKTTCTRNLSRHAIDVCFFGRESNDLSRYI